MGQCSQQAREIAQADLERRKRRAYEESWQEIARLYIQDFRELDAGKPFALFNLVRLSNLYAVACVCYYNYAFSPMQDATFDSLCQFLYDHFEEAQAAGVWSGVLDKDMLAAGSGYHWSEFRLPIHNIAFFVPQIMKREP